MHNELIEGMICHSCICKFETDIVDHGVQLFKGGSQVASAFLTHFKVIKFWSHSNLTLTVATSSKSTQTAFTLRTLHAHGLSGRALWTVTQAHILSRLTYACSAWWGFVILERGRDQLAALVIRLAIRLDLPPNQPTLHEMVATAGVKFFNQVVANPAHVLAPLIQPSKSHSYNLRKRPYDLHISLYQTNISDKIYHQNNIRIKPHLNRTL